MKPNCKLIGTDGNVFAIIGKVRETLRQNNQFEESITFSEQATKSSSYDEVLSLVHEYVNVL